MKPNIVCAPFNAQKVKVSQRRASIYQNNKKKIIHSSIFFYKSIKKYNTI